MTAKGSFFREVREERHQLKALLCQARDPGAPFLDKE